MSQTVLSVGAACFGVATGFITYRTLVRTNQNARISDLAAVLAAVGGGAVTALLPPDPDAFGWYSIGLLAGMAVYFVLAMTLRNKGAGRDVLGDPSDDPRPR